MREIKFRAWDNKKKEWLFGYELPNLGGFSLLGETVLLDEFARTVNQFVFHRNGYNADDLKVMQYTGLKDKNGKEIYEGDIVAVEDSYVEPITDEGQGPTEEFCHLSKVVFEDGQFGVKVKERGDIFGIGFHSLMEINQETSEYNIIGNIYENSDLLK